MSTQKDIVYQVGGLPEDDFDDNDSVLEDPGERQFVINKDGQKEDTDFRKIIDKVERLAEGIPHVIPNEITKEVISNYSNGCTTSDLDFLAMKAAINYPTHHQGYKILAGRLFVDDLHRRTPKTFSLATKALFEWGTLSREYHDFVEENANELDSIVVNSLDRDFGFFSLCTWAQLYLLKAKGQTIERPQYAYMREAVGMCAPRRHSIECQCFKCVPSRKRKKPGDGPVPIFTHGQMTREVLAKIKKTYYELAISKRYVMASPTKFNIGTVCGQLSSCFTSQIKGDSVDGIYDTLKQDAKISQSGGGIGNHISNIRAAGSRIVTTNGKSNGLVPMIKVYNDTARYMDQCCMPGTVIYTYNGPKAIEFVVAGDRVLTADGSYQSVKQVIRHDVDTPVISIRLRQSFEKVTYTQEHQVLALKNPHNIKHQYMVGRLNSGAIGFEFHDAKDLAKNDFLVFPIPQEVKDFPMYEEEDCRMYGLIASSGGMDKRRAWVRIPNGQDYIVDFVREYCSKRGIHIRVDFEHPGFVTIKWSLANPRFKFGFNHVYGDGDTLRMHEIFTHLPLNKTKQLLRGIIEGGGNFTDDKIVFGSMGGTFAEQIRYQFLRLGILTSGESLHHPRVTVEVSVNRDVIESFPCFAWRGVGKNLSTFRYKNYVLSKIEIVQQNSFKGLVYDFEVAGNHTYTTHAGICHNGGGKRKGAFAMWIEPWHPDFLDVLEMKLAEGSDETRARDLFFGVWNNDIFMERLQASNGGRNKVNWSFFCPKDVPELFTTWGDEFRKIYEEAEGTPKCRKTMDIWDVWSRVLYIHQKTGIPYLMHKDTINRRNNQAHIGTIKGKIVEYTSPDEVSVCNLANIPLPSHIYRTASGEWVVDYEKIIETAYILVGHVNEIIDRTRYPIPEARYSNMRHRPMGLGVQGLADVYQKMRIPFTSVEAQEINHRIFEAILYGAYKGSMELAKIDGPYETYQGSKVSQGILCFDECKRPDIFNDEVFPPADGYYNSYNPDGSVKTHLDWTWLRGEIAKYGIRNSLLVAPMPTASTSKIMGFNEQFEMYTTNIFDYQTLVGTNEVVNPNMVEILQERGLWTAEIFEKIVADGGSVQNIPEIPRDVKDILKTVWEASIKAILLMAHARGLFIDQSQSFNVHLANIDDSTAVQILGFLLGLKTGQYYFHTRSIGTNMEVKQTKEENPVSKKRSREDEEERPTKKLEIARDENGEILYCMKQEGCIACN